MEIFADVQVMRKESQRDRKLIKRFLFKGYRSILDAMKSFAKDENPIDIEDLNQMKCLNDGCQSGDTATGDIVLIHKNSKWLSPNTIDNLIDCLKENNYKLIAGNTAKGIFKQETPGLTLINIQNIKELYEIRFSLLNIHD